MAELHAELAAASGRDLASAGRHGRGGHAANLYQAHGTVMKEYVAVPARLPPRTAELAPYLAKSYDYANSLKPKPASRQR